MAAAQQKVASEREAEELLDNLLRDAVGRCMIADVPVGVFLSGGIDSATVAALMQTQSDRPIRSFTIGFRNRDYNEAVYAGAVARHVGTDHNELYVDEKDARDVIPLLPQIYDEPFADSSQIATFLVSKLARHSVTVSLSGDGGDELFGGYNRHIWASSFGRGGSRSANAIFARAISALPASALERMANLLPERFRPPDAGGKVRKWAMAVSASSPEAAYARILSLWDESQSPVFGARETDDSGAPHLLPVGDFAEQMMMFDAETYLPGDILVKVDRAAMAASLESRMPLLDHRVVELAWRLPSAMKIRGGKGKWLLRRVLNRYMPETLFDRPKAGFSLPIGEWLRGPLRDWAESLLSESRLREAQHIDPIPVRRLWADHLCGRRNGEHALWAVLMFQAWLEHRKSG